VRGSSSFACSALFSIVIACGGPEEAIRVKLRVATHSESVTRVTTDLGYEVELTEARMALENLEFALAGEAHASSDWPQLSDLLIPVAHAHPGHYESGDVTGELNGKFIADFLPTEDRKLGTATLLAGTYKSANFTFRRASTEDELDEGDLLLGHTALLRGHVTRGDFTAEFRAFLDSPEDRALSGVPFEFEVRESSKDRLYLELLPLDPYEEDTLFDGIDFEVLSDDEDVAIELREEAESEAATAAYNQLRRTFQTHDHFRISVQGT
jgi:hypothetical protein